MSEKDNVKKTTSPIDLSSVLERIGGDKSFLQELLDLYIEDFSEKYGQLNQAIEQKNYDLIRELGHSLKGSSANLSFFPLQETSCQIEIAGKEENIEKAEQALVSLKYEFKKLKDYLSKKENLDYLPKSSAENSESSLKGQILAADDSIDSQLLLKSFTNQVGIELDIANNGKEAVELFQRKKYALIFLDIHMPEMNGFEAFEKIRSIEKEKSLSFTPIIALTGASFPEDKKKCLSLGFNDYVEKPYDKEKILKIIHQYLKICHDISPSEDIQVDESIKDLVPDYLKNRKIDVEKMNNALRENNFSSIESIAHKIKGSGGSYGFTKMSQIAQQLEISAKENNYEETKNMIKNFKHYLDNIKYE